MNVFHFFSQCLDNVLQRDVRPTLFDQNKNMYCYSIFSWQKNKDVWKATKEFSFLWNKTFIKEVKTNSYQNIFSLLFTFPLEVFSALQLLGPDSDKEANCEWDRGTARRYADYMSSLQDILQHDKVTFKINRKFPPSTDNFKPVRYRMIWNICV